MFLFCNNKDKDCEVLTPVLDDKLKSLPQEKEAKLKKVKDYLRDRWGDMFRQEDCNED